MSHPPTGPSPQRRLPVPRILIAGVGNELLCDDGVGVYTVRALEAEPLPGVTLAEVGTAILHGVGFLDGVDRVLVIDAARGGRPPGTLYLFKAAANAGADALTSIHAMGLCEAARLLLYGKPVPPITILGIEPESLAYGMGLSRAVQAALPRVLALARQTVAAWRQALPPGERRPSAPPVPVIGEFESCPNH